MILALIALLGLVAGSFLTAFVNRLHEGRNFVSDRSTCDSCRQKLTVLDLIPLFSWLLLRGRCRHCQKKVSFYYPLVELVSLITFVLFYLYWPLSFIGWDLVLFIGWLFILVGLLALSIYDLRWWLLPNKILYPVFILGLLLLGVRLLDQGDLSLLLKALWSFLAGGGLFYLLFQVSDRHIGGGDVKLGFLLGILLLNWQLSLLTIFLSCLGGTIFVIPLLLWQKKSKIKLQTKLPFGPFLILSALSSFLFGEQIINWYLGFV